MSHTKTPFEMPIRHMSDLDLLEQALRNQAKTYGQGSATYVAFNSLAGEIHRLRRIKEQDEERWRNKQRIDDEKAAKITGQADLDDDIPF